MKNTVRYNHFIYTVLFLLCTLHGFSQRYNIRGIVSTRDSDDIIWGNILLVTDKDSTVARFASIQEGLFFLDSISAGEYRLEISCMGFAKKTETISLYQDKEIQIILEDRTIDLSELVVMGNKPIFVNQSGNLKINLNAPYFSAFSDLTDLLGNMPTVIVSPDQESLEVIGKGNPLIYLGNRQISLDELKSLSVEDIASIEIINNPSAKYDAEGRAVILLQPKKSRQDGYKVTLTERITQKHYFNNNLGAHVSWMKNKFELRAAAEYNQLKVWEKNRLEFTIPDDNIRSNYTVRADTKRPQFKMGLGAYYQLTEQQYISMNMTGSPLYETYPITAETYINNQGQEDVVFTENYSKDNGLFYTANLNYELKFPNIDARLFLGGQYSLYDKRVKSDIYDTYHSSSESEYRHRKQQYKINSYSFKADYEQQFNPFIRWEIGAKVSASDAFTDMKTVSDILSANEDTESQYDEYIYAAYTQLSGNVSIFTFSAGIRAEHTDIRRYADMPEENHTKLFPKISAEIAIDSTKSLNLNYGKSIARPSYSNTSKMEVYINPFYTISGNMYLKPTVTDEISINFQLKNMVFGANYYYKENPIYFNREYDNDKKLLKSIYDNFQKEEGVNIYAHLPVSYKSFSSMNTVMGTYNKVQNHTAEQLETKPYLYIYSNNQYRFPKNFVFSLSGWGYTKRKEGALVKNGMIVVNASLSRTFFGKLDCILLFTDIFNSLRFTERTVFNNIETKSVHYADYRSVALSLKYSFGKESASKYRNQAIDENINRMR